MEGLMRPAKYPWACDLVSQNVLLFAQLMDEMLDPLGYFRAYSLDTMARLTEAISVIEDVEAGRLPRQALDPVLREVEWSLDKDPVASHICGDQIQTLRDTIENTKCQLPELRAHLILVRNLLLAKSYSTLPCNKP
jgi:hypothetical protein